MMNKKYLMNGFAALALVASVSSCTKDVTTMSQGEIDAKAKENAELQLGISIPDGQTWDMASQVEANVTVNGDYGANYTVTIYENNPFIDNTGVVLGKAKVTSGGTATFDFTCPDNLYSAYAAIKDEKGYTYVKPVGISNGKIETTFGGDAPAGARSMRSARSSAADDFTVAVRTQPDFSAYINDAVAINDENNTTNPANTVRHYLIPAGTTWSKNIPLIQASDPNSADIVSVYVLGTLNINENQSINGGYGGAYKLIVGNGGVVNIASGKTLCSNANQGSGYVGEIHVLAGGTITGAGKLEFANGTNTYSYNGGTIDVGTINNNGGTLYNAGVLEADHMLGGAGLSIYENAGKIHIGDAAKGSGTANTRIYNNCWFECDGTLACRNIRQGESAYIKAANLDMSGSEDGTSDAAYIWAKANSLIEITGDVSFNGVDIDGPTGTGDYAYLQLGKLTYINYAGGWSKDVITSGAITNNLRISMDDQSYNKTYDFWGLLNGTMYGYSAGQQGNGNAIQVQKNQFTAAIVEESECSPGIIPIPPTPIYETLKVYTYAFEDQTVGTDYDMNDVVLKVNYHVTSVNSSNANEVVYDKTKLDVKLVAAGATYNIKVKIGDNYIFGGEEIHNLLKVNGVAVGAGVMVNTGNGKAVTAEPYEQTGIGIPTGWNGDFTTLPVTIEVTSTGKSYSYPNTNAYPHAVMIPVDWRWPTERTIVTEAYPGTSDADEKAIDGNEEKKINGGNYPKNSFAAWAATPAAQRTATMNGWYNHPHKGKTMTNESPATND